MDSRAAARELHAEFDVESPGDIHVEAMAASRGALVVARDVGSADARVVRSGVRAYLAVARDAVRTPRGRFSIAHELGHHLLHPDVDAIHRLHGAPRLDAREHRFEREADAFASELLLPTALFAPLVAKHRPVLDALAMVAARFRVSLSVVGRRWPEHAETPCAFVESRAGIIKRAVRSKTFRGAAVQRRSLEASRANGWRAKDDALRVRENSIEIAGSDVVLSWMTHD